MKTRISSIFGITGQSAAPTPWIQFMAVMALLAVAGCQPPEERVAEYVANAEQFFEEENLVKAELEAKNALQIEPKNADARYLLALISQEKRDVNGMAGNLRIAIETRPDFYLARYRLGSLYAQVGAFELAKEQLVVLQELDPDDARTSILNARLLFNKGDLEQAEVELKKAIKAEPDNIVAMGLLASLMSTTNTDEALAIVDEAIAKTDNSRDLRLLKIDLLNRAGRDAESEYRSLISDYPDEIEYRYMFSQHLAEAGKFEEVEEVLLEAIEVNPSDQDLKLALVRYVASVRGEKEAVALLEDFLDKDPTATRLRILLADQYHIDGDAERAIAELEKIAEEEGNEDVGLAARTRIAGINIAENDVESATVILEEVLALDPLNADANYFQGVIFVLERNWKNAVSYLRTALRQKPNHARAQLLLARTHVAAGDLVLGEDAYRRFMEVSPPDASASVEFARLLVDREQFDQAEEFLAGKINALPQDPDLSKAMIAILVQRERFDAAVEEAERLASMEGNSNRSVGSYLAASIYQMRGDHEQAVATLRPVIDEGLGSREHTQALVNSLAALDRLGEAREYLQNLSEEFPENLFIKTLLGQVVAASGDKDAAREIFEATVSDKSDWLPAYAALAMLDAENPQAQIDIYRRGIEASPGDQQMALLLGSAYERRGEIEMAISTYEEALAANPDSPIVANNLAALLSDYRQDSASYKRALDVAIKLKDSEQPVLLDTLGWVYYRLGDYEQAQPLLERAVNGEPNLPVIRYHLGMTYFAQGKEQLAIEQLRAATEAPEVEYPGKEEAKQTLAELLGTD